MYNLDYVILPFLFLEIHYEGTMYIFNNSKFVTGIVPIF